MVEKGWIPTFIAPDARDIRFDGDLDSASVNGSYFSSDTGLLRKHCLNASDSLRIPVDGPKWFAKDVKESNTAGTLRLKGYEVLHCNEDDFNVVISSSHPYVYYWSSRYTR